jgi:ribokinase
MEAQPGLRVAVVGHVEWIEFARVEHVPTPGEIVHASQTWAGPGGAGAVAAVQLRKLAGGATLYTALGDDEHGHRAKAELEEQGVRVEATFRPFPQRRGLVFIDSKGERTITTVGERLGAAGDDPLAWELLDGADGVYFTAGDRMALEHARRAHVLVATSRIFEDLAAFHVLVDAVIGSGIDPDEVFRPGVLDPPPSVVILTEGGHGGSYSAADGQTGGFEAATLPGPVVDAYGCGDSFAACVTYGLASRLPVPDALRLGARCGAACLTGRGPFGGQLALSTS